MHHWASMDYYSEKMLTVVAKKFHRRCSPGF